VGETVLNRGSGEAKLRRAALVFALAVADPAGGARAQGDPAPEVEIVRAIEIRADAEVDLAEVERLIAFEVGKPFEEVRVRRTLRSLRHSGQASEAAVSKRPLGTRADGGTDVVAVVSLWTPFRLATVEIVGETGLSAERLRGALPAAAGQPLVEDRLLRGVYALKDLYVEEGYLAAKVSLGVTVDEVRRSAAATYEVAAGSRTRIGEVRFDLASAVATPGELEGALRAGEGDALRLRAVEENRDELLRFLARRDYRLARVERLPDEPGATPGTVDLAYSIEPGPRLELEIVGAERKVLEKNDLLPFLDEAGFDDAQVLHAIERIRRYFQERGHYRADVRRTEKRSPERYALKLEIVPGPKLVLEELVFAGNDSFPDDRLRQLVTTAPRRLLTPKSGRLVDAELAADLSNLRSFYALEGFHEAKVGPPEIDPAAGEIRVRIPVVEGARRTVGSLTLDGLAPLDEKEVREALPLSAGGPYHRLRVEQSVEVVRERLERLGYGSALVSSTTEWSEDGLVADVVLQAIPGRREVVAVVVVRGLEETDSEVVRRFLGLAPGDPVSREALLQMQRRLYALNLFSRVEVTVPPAGEVGDAREVVVELEEGKSRAVQLGLGYDSESGARGLLRLSHGNLFGRVSTLALDVLVSTREQYSRLLFRQPYLGSTPTEFQTALYDEHEERPDFTVDRTGVQVTLSRPIDRFSLQLATSYRIVELDADEFNDEIPLESRNARVASITPGFVYDERDDALDPRRGWLASSQLEYAAPVADAEANFLKLFGQASLYVPVGRRSVLAGSLRAGAIEPLATGMSDVDDLEASTPAAELFYAGGRTSHRAYERDSLGIVDETILVEEPGSENDPFPAGGGGLLLANLELRFPVAGPVGGTLFLDGGNVWRDYRDADPAQMKWGAGIGVRYLSPVGPLRLEIGWKLDREPFEDPYVWYFSLGNAF
jgi:outer membrane protein insertion porin family